MLLVASLLLVAMPFVTSSFLLLVAMPGAPSSGTRRCFLDSRIDDTRLPYTTNMFGTLVLFRRQHRVNGYTVYKII